MHKLIDSPCLESITRLRDSSLPRVIEMLYIGFTLEWKSAFLTSHWLLRVWNSCIFFFAASNLFWNSGFHLNFVFLRMLDFSSNFLWIYLNCPLKSLEFSHELEFQISKSVFSIIELLSGGHQFPLLSNVSVPDVSTARGYRWRSATFTLHNYLCSQCRVSTQLSDRQTLL